MSGKLRVGLALGGGGARGMAHIGVLKVLEANQIKLEAIAGTSIGAILGAAYALHPDAKALEERTIAFINAPQFKESGLDLFKKKKAAENFFGQVAKYVKERVVINLAHSRPSLVGAWRVSRAVDFMLEDKNFEDCRIPFACVATDLITGEEIVFRKGSLRKAVAASMSIPGFLPPINYNSHLLVDGAVVAPVPVNACKLLGAEVVIAVDVSQGLGGTGAFDNVIDIIFRASTITSQKYNQTLLAKADVIIRPEVGEVHWSEFHSVGVMVAEGERAAKMMLPEIQHLLERKRSIWQRLFGPR
ncbi:MAG: patatin-like phospholipase family protein [candidate division KSB1 bacterium]|nr:patatin-like phospholipase family protein [candidate division KSB1 bacterium]